MAKQTGDKSRNARELEGALAAGLLTADDILPKEKKPAPEAYDPFDYVEDEDGGVTVVEKADADRDTALIATRFDGAALELRLANYAIRGADPSIGALPAIPDGPVKLTLPQQTDTWPRTVFAVIQDDKDDTIPPVALFLEQADPRSDYKVSYAITLEPSAVLPDVAPASVGAARLAPGSGLLKFTPDDAALAYGDILEKDVESDAFLDFEADMVSRWTPPLRGSPRRSAR